MLFNLVLTLLATLQALVPAHYKSLKHTLAAEDGLAMIGGPGARLVRSENRMDTLRSESNAAGLSKLALEECG